MAFSAEDIVPDSPTNNFCTLNPLATNGTTTTPFTISDGNLKTTHNVTGQWQGAKGTISVSSGIWYFEVVILQVPTGGTENYNIGFYNADIHNSLYYGLAGNLTFGANATVAQLYVNTSFTSYGSLGSNGSIYMFCLDVDSEKFWVGLNGSWFASGNPSTGVNPSASGFGKANWTTVQSDYTYGGAGSFQHNYGQDATFGGNKTSGSADAPDANGIGSFYYQPPTGALALCTANLPDFTPTVIDDTPQDYFKAVKWTGQTTDDDMTWDGTTGTVNVGFQPDLVWLKSRNNASWGHFFQDGVRGYTNFIKSDTTDREATTGPPIVSGVYADGFYIKTNGNSNNPNDTYVAWCWKAGGAPSADDKAMVDGVESTITGDAKLDAGTITPTRMSVNTDAGFSIVSYKGTLTDGSGQTISHGLTTMPDLIIIKNRTRISTNFMVWSSGFGTNQTLRLNTPTNFISADANRFGGASSTTFSVGYFYDTGYLDDDYIAYCWHSVEGYSKFGSYTGNGSPDGPFVYCGFRPAFVMVKWTSGGGQTTGSWRIMDTARNLYNPATLDLIANEVVTETTYGSDDLDILSNGFKWRSTGSFHNTSGANYIYMAFAEQPFNYANAR